MNVSGTLHRPKTLQDIAESSTSIEEFGRNLRDWQHEIQRGGVHSRKEFASRLTPEPPRLAERFQDGVLADAMLAAYAEWLADQAKIPRPDWCKDSNRVREDPWFGSPLRGWLIANTPASFRHRNLFTIPEQVFTPKRGRPQKSREHKAQKAAERQRAYRKRVRKLIQAARTQPL
ncbi:MAG: hypothetical protein JJU05_05910 [Verrucomicrobia bacterium]|nr:hypothetical protein [Verrucomicrobiota bacterium]MCH8525676.1 hypothetical protein [Kiritimatiellia bacterium]